jgi:hypothetical protein
MGSADPRAYSRNKRGIAGSLIWINFDRHALLSLFHKALGKFVADVDEIRPQYQDSEVNSSAVFASSLTRSIGPSVGSIIDQIDNMSLKEVGGLNELATPWYADQILPFDVTLAGANEYGAMTTFSCPFRSLHHLLNPLPERRAISAYNLHESCFCDYSLAGRTRDIFRASGNGDFGGSKVRHLQGYREMV